MLNNSGRFDNEGTSEPKKVSINSIDRVQYVARNPRTEYIFTYNDFIPYGLDNLYPQKIKSIAQRSGTTISSIETLAKFVAGNGFIGMDTEVNSDGQTWWDILRFITLEQSTFNGFALHFNFNLNGQITEINTIPFEYIRIAKGKDKLLYCTYWDYYGRNNVEIEKYDYFDPSKVIEQINKVGLNKYKGQILYHRPNKKEVYPLCKFDAVLDDSQFEGEAKLYSLSNIQNDFSLSGIFAYPKPLQNDAEIAEVKRELRGDKGAKNAGGIKVIGINPTSEMANFNWFTPITRNDIDGLFKQQKEDAKFNIYACFQQPPILNGVATSGMFNQESFSDAFNYYNAQTETERKDVERILNKIISYSIWIQQLGTVQIIPKTYNNATTA